jgi:hypothetical protein
LHSLVIHFQRDMRPFFGSEEVHFSVLIVGKNDFKFK